MKNRTIPLLALLLAGCAAKAQLAPPPALAPPPLPAMPLTAWVQLGPGGAAQIRAMAEDGTCPWATVDGKPVPLAVRAAADGAFALLCEAALPQGARSASLAGRPLPLPVPAPQRILVLGDTGCRLKGAAVQFCNDPRSWPFPSVAAAAARLHPDLVLDVGDYQYRETPCPPGIAGCAGTPYGDNWPTWKADFFAPAAPLLAAAPWIFVRGNHEDCDRSGPGYLRLIGPLAVSKACVPHLAPYRVPLGGLDLMVMDDSGASDTAVVPDQVPVYRADLAQADGPSVVPVWLALHRPIWAAIAGPLGIPIGGNAQVIAAAEKTMLKAPVTLMLAGHIHSFEAINYAGGTPPPQIVAGNGGDNLDVTPADLKGAIFQGHSGAAVKDGLSVGGFGFLLLTRRTGGWTIALYDSAGVAEGRCLFTAAGDRVDCPELPGRK